jgi:hypothetical protein
MRRAGMIVALALALGLAGPAAAQEHGTKDRGFALELHLGTQVADVANVKEGQSYSGLEGGFFAGYKLGRVIFGAGLEYLRSATGATALGRTTSASDSSFLFVPGLRVTILTSADHRVELFGQADIAIGHAFTDQNAGNFLIRYQVGPGLRLWFHPQFALGAVFGLRGDFADIDDGNGVSHSRGITSLFTQFQVLAVF